MAPSRVSRRQLLRVGSAILATAAWGLLAAPYAILSQSPDPATQTGRHLIAGALALAALGIMEVALALGPIRRGEKWAMAVAAFPFFVVAVPVLILDAVYVAPARLLATLAPQVGGLLVGLAALARCAVGAGRPPKPG